jgi:hypothetical protein
MLATKQPPLFETLWSSCQDGVDPSSRRRPSRRLQPWVPGPRCPLHEDGTGMAGGSVGVAFFAIVRVWRPCLVEKPEGAQDSGDDVRLGYR